MKVKKVVKVMNFQALLNINNAKKKAEMYKNVGEQITNILGQIYYNKNLILDQTMIEPNPSQPKLNIYIANDYGFCGNFNSTIRHQILEDKDDYKIIIGKKISYNDDKTLLKINKEDFYQNINKIEQIIDNGLENMDYSEINLHYIHYYSYTQFGYVKLKLFPIEVTGEYYEGGDYVYETDINKMIKGIISFYICYQLKMAEAISIASENVMRNQITSIALDKIEGIELKQLNQIRKIRLAKNILKNVENYNKSLESERYE